jgi:hypothetical protein
MKEGGWVFLDNVHLMQGWIPRLERRLEAAADSVHPDFRCFFSAEPINGAPQVGHCEGPPPLGRGWEARATGDGLRWATACAGRQLVLGDSLLKR